jgi:Glycosyl hydrolases family 43
LSRVKLSTPTYGWEINHTPYVNEGPEVLIHNGKFNLVYSASGSWTNDYCLGLITASTASDPLNPQSWHKRSEPVFTSGNGVYGPGHAGFTKSPDGNEDWILYHTARYEGAGWTRQIRAQRFVWNADDTPDFGVPADPNQPISVTSGEVGRQRYEVEASTLANGPYAVSEPSASTGRKVGYIDYDNSYVEFTVTVNVFGYYILAARTGNGTSGGSWATHRLSVNGSQPQPFYVANWGMSTAKVWLNQGQNTVRFTKGDHYAEIDCLDVFATE